MDRTQTGPNVEVRPSMVVMARPGEPGLRSDGSIDYHFYRARKCLAQAGPSAARHVVRGLTMIAEWLVARGDEPGLEIRHRR